MSRAPAKPAGRKPAGPTNTSRAAGAPAPASAAATAPSFYSPAGGLAAAEEAIRPAPDSPAEAQQRHVEQVRATAIETGTATTVDHTLIPTPQGVETDESLEDAIARIRATRKPLGGLSQKLALDPIPGYHLHWFNDESGRIDEAKLNGWAHVLDRDKKPLKRAVGTGKDRNALFAYAMKLPSVFWEEDMARRHQVADKTIAATKANPFAAAPGSTKPTDAGKFYSPVEMPVSIEKG